MKDVSVDPGASIASFLLYMPFNFTVQRSAQATVWFADAYFSHPGPESDILAVARLTAFLKQVRNNDIMQFLGMLRHCLNYHADTHNSCPVLSSIPWQ